MKIYAAVAVVFAVLTIGPSARAQTCTSPIVGWQGRLSLTGSGTATGSNGITDTVNEAAADSVNADVVMTSCTKAIWSGSGTNPTGSVNDKTVRSCPPPSKSPKETYTFTGSTFDSESIISIDLSGGTYSYVPTPFATVTIASAFCDGTTKSFSDGAWPIFPANWFIPTFAPPTFPLPSTVQSLTGNMANFPGVWAWGGVTIPWNLSFTLDPIIDDSDKPCKEQGRSSVGCQNQSLGEDLSVPGTGFVLHYESSRMPGSIGANRMASADAVSNGGWTLSIHHVYDPSSRNLYLGNGDRRSRWQLGNPVTLNGGKITAVSIFAPGTGYKVNDILTVVQSGASGGTLKVTSVGSGGITGLSIQASGTGYSMANGLATTGGTGTGATVSIAAGNYGIASEDGSEVYVFDSTTARHIQTVKPLTGALIYQFAYDASGNLVTITDASGNLTSIKRGSNGLPIAIVSPFGQTTTLATDLNRFLSKVTDPAGHFQTFTYSNGLMTSRKDANGNSSSYAYDSSGRLTKDADSAGGFITLGRTKTLSAGTLTSTVTETTSTGRTSAFQTVRHLSWTDNGTSHGEQHTNTWSSGLQPTSSISLQNGNLSEGVTLPDGTSGNSTSGPDPRWGLQVPIRTSETIKQGGLTMNVTGSRTASLATAGNPFSLTSETDKKTINGRSYTSAFTTSNRTFVESTPVGRKVTTVFDALERVASKQADGLIAIAFAYDSRGRLSNVTQGTRHSAFTYDSNGRLATVTDPLGLTDSFTYDPDGRLLSTTLPDGRIVGYTHDANGNLTSLTPPGKLAHDFNYTSVDETSEYLPPIIPGAGPTMYSYNADRDITKISRPDLATITFQYDNAGRPSSVITPSETINYTYSSATGNLTGASSTNGEALTYSYNGPLPTGTGWTGTVSGSVSRAYDNNFWVTSQSLNGANTIAFNHDNDGLVTMAGGLTLNRSAQNGFVTNTALGLATDVRSYNMFGEPIGYTASYNAAHLYSESYTRDADGRVTGKTETIGGTTNTVAYTYDLAGRLTGVTKNGSAVSSYTYDTNSNRTKATTTSGTATATYDAQDRLLTYGAASYTYTANGELATQKIGTQTTTYNYDVLGNLISVTLPGGKAISYVVDAENRRVGKKVNGIQTAGFLYDGDKIIAQLNGSNAIVSQFIYASGSTAPDYMVSGGVTYRIFSDQLGSPRLVVNTSAGTVVERIDYDEFGNIINDTNPGLLPFGFAGGLYDPQTKLIRFGARDYDPSTGRWTAKDPILFNGGDTNIYGYVLADPVNKIDPLGLSDCDACTDEAKKVGRKIIKQQLKVFNARDAEDAARSVQKGIIKETSHAPLREYREQLKETEKTCEKGVKPTATEVERIWIKSAKAINPNPANY